MYDADFKPKGDLTLFIEIHFMLFNVMSYKKAVLPQGNRAMLQVFFSVEVRQQHFLQV